jgi:hypothetical protein
MRALWIAGCLFVSLVAVSARAEPRPYRGAHPIDHEGHWHDDPSVHVHDDLPIGLGPFVSIDGALVFLSDPVAYGYRGDVWTYGGTHPLPPSYAGVCGIAGEHRHNFVPEGEYRRDENGSFHFTGALRGGSPTYVPGRPSPPESASTTSWGEAEMRPPPVPWGLPICSPDVPPGFGCVHPLGDGVEVIERERRRRPRPAPRPPMVRAEGRRHSAAPLPLAGTRRTGPRPAQPPR